MMGYRIVVLVLVSKIRICADIRVMLQTYLKWRQKMQFNIWVNNELMKDIEVIMKSEGKKKNAIINEAIAEYIKYKKSKRWSNDIKNFKGIKGFKEENKFENFRDELKEVKWGTFGDKK